MHGTGRCRIECSDNRATSVYARAAGQDGCGPADQGMGEYRSEGNGRAVNERHALKHDEHEAGRSPNSHVNKTVNDRVVPASRVHARAWWGI